MLAVHARMRTSAEGLLAEGFPEGGRGHRLRCTFVLRPCKCNPTTGPDPMKTSHFHSNTWVQISAFLPVVAVTAAPWSNPECVPAPWPSL